MGYPPSVGGFCGGFVLGCFFGLVFGSFAGFELKVAGKGWLPFGVL